MSDDKKKLTAISIGTSQLTPEQITAFEQAIKDAYARSEMRVSPIFLTDDRDQRIAELEAENAQLKLLAAFMADGHVMTKTLVETGQAWGIEMPKRHHYRSESYRGELLKRLAKAALGDDDE